MTIPNTQPVLPAEGVPTSLEELFISEQPQNLFPVNQNSNFGTIRKVLTDEMQDAANTLAALFSEMFISTASGYLGLWETQMGLPKSPAARTDAYRRVLIANRRKIAPFTRTRRRLLVEQFITATFGDPVMFSPEGILFDSGGIILHSEYADISAAYSITEDAAFHYIVNIIPTVDPDITALTRELDWLTPSGITFSITRDP